MPIKKSLYTTLKKMISQPFSIIFSDGFKCLCLLIFLIKFCVYNDLNAQYEIKGAVYRYDSAIISLNGKITLYEYSNDDKQDKISQQLTIDSKDSGHYIFSNVIPGMYYVGVDFYDEGYIVSYFGGDIYWRDADVIEVDSFSVVATNIYISKKPNNMGGRKRIVGSLKEGSLSRGPSDPIGGIDIGMFNSNGDLVGYERTDSMGIFIIDSIVNGSFSFIADIAGIKVDSNSMSNLVVNNSIDSLILDIIVDSNSVYANVSQTVDVNKNLSKPSIVVLYPNPAQNRLLVNLVSKKQSKNILMKVYNTVGEVYYVEDDISTNGSYSIDISMLPAGIYFIELVSKDFYNVKRFFKK